MYRWHQAPCMYCCDPVGADAVTDDGEFFVCGRCRRQAERRREEVAALYGSGASRAAAEWPEPDFDDRASADGRPSRV